MKKIFKPTSILKYIFLIILCLIFAFPFIWMVSAATNSRIDILRGNLLPGIYFMENLTTLLDSRPVISAMANSIMYAIIGTFASLFICSMAGYGFQIYRNKIFERLMAILLLSMMVPFAAIMIPLFRMFSQMGLMNSVLGVILPSVSTAFLIFFFRQSTMSFPKDIVDSARVDGVGEFGIYARIFTPIMAPTFAAAAIVSFMIYWNNYMWPLVILQRQGSQTMPLVLAGITAGYIIDYGMLMAAVFIFTLPMVIIFITQQKRFVVGILGAVKG